MIATQVTSKCFRLQFPSTLLVLVFAPIVPQWPSEPSRSARNTFHHRPPQRRDRPRFRQLVVVNATDRVPLAVRVIVVYMSSLCCHFPDCDCPTTVEPYMCLRMSETALYCGKIERRLGMSHSSSRLPTVLNAWCGVDAIAYNMLKRTLTILLCNI